MEPSEEQLASAGLIGTASDVERRSLSQANTYLCIRTKHLIQPQCQQRESSRACSATDAQGSQGSQVAGRSHGLCMACPVRRGLELMQGPLTLYARHGLHGQGRLIHVSGGRSTARRHLAGAGERHRELRNQNPTRVGERYRELRNQNRGNGTAGPVGGAWKRPGPRLLVHVGRTKDAHAAWSLRSSIYFVGQTVSRARREHLNPMPVSHFALAVSPRTRPAHGKRREFTNHATTSAQRTRKGSHPTPLVVHLSLSRVAERGKPRARRATHRPGGCALGMHR